MNIGKNSLALKDKDKMKKSSLNLRKKSFLNKLDKEKYQKTKQKLFINITKENSAEKENNKNHSNNLKQKQIKYPKIKKKKNKSNKNFMKETIKITNLSSFKYKNKNRNKSPEKKKFFFI